MKNNIFSIFNLRFAIIGIALILVFSSVLNAQISTGGDFAIQQKVIAGGGGESTDSTTMIFRMEGTLGQNAAGTQMSGGDFTQRGGFWNPLFAPTAAEAEISGRVLRGKGQGIRNVFVTLTGGLLTAPRIARTNQFGYFKFTGVDVGHFYVLEVQHKNIKFSNPTQSFTLNDNAAEIVFLGN